MAETAPSVIPRDAYRNTVAEAWAANNLLILVLPTDENTNAEARGIREKLLSPLPDGRRTSVPPLERTWCAESGTRDSLFATIAEESGVPGDLTDAVAGRSEFYGAVSGVRLPPDQSLRSWIDRQMRTIAPSGMVRDMGNLHILGLLTCPLRATEGVPPFPDGIDVRISPPMNDWELVPRARAMARDVWPGAQQGELEFITNALLDMASDRTTDLELAVEALENRGVRLVDITNGARIGWDSSDPQVEDARHTIAQLGLYWEGLQLHKVDGPIISGADIASNLWEAGLWRPSALDWQPGSSRPVALSSMTENWMAGITSRAWVALGLTAGVVAIERSVLEVLRHCLMLERTCRLVLTQALRDTEGTRVIEEALLRVDASGSSLHQRIVLRLPRGEVYGPSTETLVNRATFREVAQFVEVLANVKEISLDSRCLTYLVNARNDVAHGTPPTIQQYTMVLTNASRMVESVRTIGQ